MLNPTRKYGPEKVPNVAFDELDPDKQALVTSDDPVDRAMAAEMGLGMEVLIDDENPYVRYLCARNEYGLNKLADDPDWHVAELIKFELRTRYSDSLEVWAAENPEQVAEIKQEKMPKFFRVDNIPLKPLKPFKKDRAATPKQDLAQAKAAVRDESILGKLRDKVESFKAPVKA